MKEDLARVEGQTVMPSERATASPDSGDPRVAQHSPLPWHVFDENFPHHHYPGIEAPGYSVVTWGAEDDEAGVRGHTAQEARSNAEFIVRAVNCHDDLLAALKELREARFLNVCDIEECGCESSQLAKRIDGVIAKADRG